MTNSTKLSEKEFQELFIERLKKEFKHFGKTARFYQHGNGLKPVGHRKINDVVIFHDLKHKQLPKHKQIPSPIGVELKTGYSLNQINKALHDQIENGYANLQFEVKEENWAGYFPLWAFSNINLLNNGVAYGKHYPDASTFFIERFAWMANIATIMRDKTNHERLVIRWNNKGYYFNDKHKTIMKWDE